MLSKKILLVSALALLLTPAVQAAEDTWTIDPLHSDAEFRISHMMISNVGGAFDKISGTAHYDGTDLEKASVNATIPVDSISTRVADRDAHLKSPDFLDAIKYPTMTFQSKKFETLENGDFKMVGDLTIHGVTKEVAFDGKLPSKPIKDPRGKMRLGATATTKISRKDFGISFNKMLDNGNALVGDDVDITLNVEFVKPTAQ